MTEVKQAGMTLNKQIMEHKIFYLKASYKSVLEQLICEEIGMDEFMKNVKEIQKMCDEACEWMIETTEHHAEEILGELYEGKAF